MCLQYMLKGFKLWTCFPAIVFQYVYITQSVYFKFKSYSRSSQQPCAKLLNDSAHAYTNCCKTEMGN